MTTLRQVNHAVRPLGVELIRGDGYFYFLDLRTQDQIGSSVTVFRLNHASLDFWVSEAVSCRMEWRKEQYYKS